MLDRVFLDSNVIFSAAYRPTTELRWLWTLPDLELLTSHYAILEALRNLPPTRHDDVQELLQGMTIVPTPGPGTSPLPPMLVLPAKDVPIFPSAAAAGATHLLTGDKRHFGAHFGHRFEGVLILAPRAYLRSRS